MGKGAEHNAPSWGKGRSLRLQVGGGEGAEPNAPNWGEGAEPKAPSRECGSIYHPPTSPAASAAKALTWVPKGEELSVKSKVDVEHSSSALSTASGFVV